MRYNLTSLNLSYNKISQLPKEITQLENLRQLCLKSNPIQNPPIEVLGNLYRVDLSALRRYFQQQEEQGIDILYEAKFLIIGKGGVGKTSLARRIQNPDALLPSDNESTHGIDVTVWPFTLENGNTFRVNIWDFGGQAIYHATHQFFLTKSALYALIVDTRRDHSEQLDLELYWWLSAVELLSDNSPVFIIKNEKDDRFFQINEPALRERFSNLINQVHSSNFKTNRGRKAILDTLKYQISHLPHVGKPLPKTWVKVRRALENDSRNYIPINTYLELCEQHGFKERQYALDLSQTLHNLGVCLHFQDNDLLAKTVILKPEWGTTAVYQILDNETVKRNFGRFDRTDLQIIWHDEQYAGMQGELLELMKKFELCYELPEKINISLHNY